MKMMFLGSYTPNALKGLIGGSDRKAAVEAILDQVGGTLDQMLFTRGEYDIVVIASAPDNTNLPGITAALRASGAFEKAVALEEVDIKEVVETAQKISGAYKPAG
ncbi:MAG: GYD domain-containing protein [Rhodospirillaceae bacterium]|nr:GYD domain-containing protein [Rhodospirillaceae bacterium]|tara:strand:+ start:2132 stop:2446 length:315 start_codon:yes stop_codon:yes gene_type:complete